MPSVPARRPLPDIPQHVVQPPRARLLPRHLVGAASAVAAVPRDAVDIAIPALTASRPRRILPLRLSRQPASDCLAVRLRRTPTDLFHGEIGAFEMARMRSHDSLVGRLRHFGLPQPESLGYGDFVGRFFIGSALRIPRRAAHSERSPRNPHVPQPVFLIQLGQSRSPPPQRLPHRTGSLGKFFIFLLRRLRWRRGSARKTFDTRLLLPDVLSGFLGQRARDKKTNHQERQSCHSYDGGYRDLPVRPLPLGPPRRRTGCFGRLPLVPLSLGLPCRQPGCLGRLPLPSLLLGPLCCKPRCVSPLAFSPLALGPLCRQPSCLGCLPPPPLPLDPPRIQHRRDCPLHLLGRPIPALPLLLERLHHQLRNIRGNIEIGPQPVRWQRLNL